MAAQFPPNLDDGELWLPSDIIPELGYPRRISGGRDVKSLPKPLADLGLLDPCAYSKGPEPAIQRTPDPAEGFWPMNGFGFGYDGYRVPAATGAFMPRSTAVPQFYASRMVQPQAAVGFGQVRSGAAARSFPSRVNGSGRACAGTGVFLPRVYSNSEANEVKRKPTSLENGEHQKQAERNTVRKTAATAAAKQMVTLMQAPPELTLPQEWTY